MQKETFIIRTEWYDAIAELEPTDQATILRNLFLYHLDDTNDMVLDTLGVRIVWKLIEPTLSRNMDTYDRKVQTNRENGKLGGRPITKTKTETQINPNNPTVILPITQTKVITLSDSDSEYDNEYDYDSESEDVLKNSLSPEKIKNYPDEVLKAPTPDNAADAIFYEVEICKNLRISFDELPLIWNKWMNSRSGKLLTKREARNDFRSYASSYKLGDKHRSPNQRPTTQAAAPIYEPSG